MHLNKYKIKIPDNGNRPYIKEFIQYSGIIIIFILIISSRALNLDADPPVHLSSSGGLFGDEAALAHNARNKVLFGHWITDEWNPLVYNPILSILEYISFSFFGVGLVQLRLVNVICVISSFFILWRILIRSHNSRIAFTSVIILGFNYVFIMYNRLGLNDTFIFFPMMVTLYFWQHGLSRKPFLFFSGMASFAVYITKASSLYFVLAAFLSLFFALFQKYQEEKKIKDIFSSLGLFIGGLIFSYICWYFLFFTPLKTEFEKVGESWVRLAWPGTIGRFWYNLMAFTFTKYMNNTPIELFIVWGYLPIFLYIGIRYWKNINPMEVFIWLWLIGGFTAISGLSYRPLRYFVPIIPPLCLSASFALNRFWNILENKEYRPRLSSVLWFILISTGVAFWVFFFLKKCISVQRILQVGYPVMGISLLLTFIFILIDKVKKKPDWIKWKNMMRVAARSIAVACVAYSFYLNSTLYLRWYRHPRYTVVETSRELGKILDNAYIAGLWSPLATIENHHRALYVGNNWFNYINTFDRFPVTHLFLWDGNNQEELRYFNGAYPKIMENANLIKTYSIKDLPVRLIQINKKD